MTTKKLTLRQKILVAGTLFGMFFGAGNLIFPVHLGQMAGQNALPAIIGFIITAVGIPILGVAAIGVTHSDGLQTLSGKVGKGYGIFFTCLLYLTIGPLFAIPRCATVSFTTGITPLLGADSPEQLYLLLFRRCSSPSCSSSLCVPVRSPSGSARSSTRSSCSSLPC